MTALVNSGYSFAFGCTTINLTHADVTHLLLGAAWYNGRLIRSYQGILANDNEAVF